MSSSSRGTQCYTLATLQSRWPGGLFISFHALPHAKCVELTFGKEVLCPCMHIGISTFSFFCVISGLGRSVNEIFALLGCYAELICRLSFIHTNSCTFSVQLTSPHSKHYRHTKHMLPHNHDGLIIHF